MGTFGAAMSISGERFTSSMKKHALFLKGGEGRGGEGRGGEGAEAHAAVMG